MDPHLNPYSPGAGLQPAALVGRSSQVDAWSVSLARSAAGRSERSMVLHGLRGVGKTVLLRHLAARAEAQDWIVGHVEAGTGSPLAPMIAETFGDALEELDEPTLLDRVQRSLSRLRGLSAGVDPSGTVTLGVELGGTEAPRLERTLIRAMRDLAAVASGKGAGVALMIDEAQDLDDDDLVALCSVAHEAGQRGLPVLFCLAGLPNLPSVLTNARSYSERLFAYHPIRELGAEAAAAALVAPSAPHGVAWSEAALGHVLAETEGYPYFLQEYGSAIWKAAIHSPISLHAAQVGAELALAHLDAGFFRARWDRATPTEQDYLRHMAIDGPGPSRSGEVASRQNRRVQDLGQVRAGLIGKGLIYAPEHGKVAFTVPKMADFIERQP